MKLSPARVSAVIAYLFGTTMASAVIIGTSGFEGAATFENGYYYTYAFDYAGYGNGGPNVDLMGNAVVSASPVDTGMGVGGSSAFRLTFDATAVPAPGQPYPTPTDPAVQYSYYGVGGGDGLAVLNAPTSANLADYRFSVDLRALGLTGASAAVEFTIEIQAPDDTLGGDPDTGNDLLAAFSFTVAGGDAFIVGPAFSTFTTTLDQNSGITGGSLANFTQFGSLASVININFQMNNGAGEFGLDANNGLILDNQTFEQVPEPGVCGMLALGVAGLGLRRRR
jgi:hypothetical protein